MPAYIPGYNENVAVRFTRKNSDGTITKDSRPTFGIVNDTRSRKTAIRQTNFDDGDKVDVNYKQKGLDWFNEDDLRKIAANSIVSISKARNNPPSINILSKTRKHKPRKSKPKKRTKIGGSKPSSINLLRKTRKRKQKKRRP